MSKNLGKISFAKQRAEKGLRRVTPAVIEQPQKLRNVFRGLVPVATTWDTAPTDLVNCTDGDFNTVTGTGEKTLGAGGQVGALTFDLGRVKTVLVGARVGLWTTANVIYFLIASSDDNITYRVVGTGRANMLSSSATEQIQEASNCGIATGRYIRVIAQLSGAATGYMRFYEIMGWELTV